MLAQSLQEHRSSSWSLGSMGVYGACSDREEYGRCTVARYFAFGALERAFAAQPRASLLARLWVACPELHGAPRKLEHDLRAVGVDGTTSTPSEATAAYVANVEELASNEEDSAVLLGHFYAHYVANLVEAPVEGRRAQLAMGLAPGTPEICRLPENVEEDRPGYLRTVLKMFDAVSKGLDVDERRRAAEGAADAFSFVAAMHSERRLGLATGTALGVARVASGYVAEKLRGTGEAESDSQMQLLLPNDRIVITPHA